MKSLSLEDDLHQFIMKKVADTGKDPSTIVREYIPVEISPSGSDIGKNGSNDLDPASEGLSNFLDDANLSTHSYAVHRYLAILSRVYQQKPQRFGELEDKVTGSKRKYFDRDPDRLARSGKSVNPKRIPESPYHTTTNNNTSGKRERLKKVLRVLDYDERVVQKAADSI